MRTWDLIGNRRWGYLLSALVIVAGLVGIAAWGIDFGIDFTGGTLLDLQLGREASLAEVRATLGGFGLEEAQIQKAGDRPREVLIRTRVLEEAEVARLQRAFSAQYGGAQVLRAERVGPRIGQELRRQAVVAVLVGLALQVLYITWRFRSVRFALAADVALVHDLLIVLGLYALTRRTVDSSFVAVLLTVVGYSINDTVVILDRIRENQQLRTREPFPRLVNRSILEVLVRSLTTGFGAIIALLILYFYGGPTLRDFIFGLGAGVVTGTYSSIFVASPLLVEWHLWAERRAGRSPAARPAVETPPAAKAAAVGAAPAPARLHTEPARQRRRRRR
ncbi:MAG: protein translocase subunit SecF [Armatimonadota bacterium]|nr:protein translocase subunit SecF [Armatimonadota bacterium]MDR7447591.1 protein translocase subunit SecF [Armatimonadota bacterium]MDR7459528.1 protein translocase subunit SecF [Armatimonadota bacterium]MDR7480506.1 protein translocase subunit SecF [Armatimonadota bacterium]MDR7489100.1 protein translocase subunit SecF [Armatimonadota bacterium]